MKYFRIAIALFSILLGIKAVHEVFNGLEETIIPGIEYWALLLLMLFTYGAFRIDRYHYKPGKKLYQFASSITGLIFCGIVFFKLIQYKMIDYSNTVLKASNLPGASNVLKFAFKKNNQFLLEEHNMLGKTSFYGRYKKQHDTIFIMSNNYNGYAKQLPRKGVIYRDTVYWKNFDTMLVNWKITE